MTTLSTTLKRLEQEHVYASFEAQGSHSLAGYAETMLKPLQKGLSAFVGLFTPSQSMIALKANVPGFLKQVNALPYTDIRDYTVYVPEGLKVSYPEYLDALEPAILHAGGVQKVLDDFATYLSLLIHRPDAIKETRSFLNLYGDIDANREQVLKKVGACFHNGLNQTEVKLSKVMPNNKLWESVIRRLDAINQVMTDVSHKALDKKVEETLGLLGTLRRQIEVEKKEASPETLTNLSSGTFLVAKELEFYAAMWYRVESFTHAVDATIAKIEDLEHRQVSPL